MGASWILYCAAGLPVAHADHAQLDNCAAQKIGAIAAEDAAMPTFACRGCLRAAARPQLRFDGRGAGLNVGCATFWQFPPVFERDCKGILLNHSNTV